MKKFTMLLALLVFIMVQAATAQNRKLTGTVTSSEDGSTLPGVSVVAKGTTIGTITDLDGKYTLEVPADTKALVFTFVGMKTVEVMLGADNVVNITLEPDVKQVEEVVVTALGVTRQKKSLGYAVTEVKGELLTQTKSPNFINSISGKVAGVQIKNSGNMGGSTNIVIRGSKSLTQNNQPLFIIDGVPVDNSITNSNQQVSGRNGYDYGNAAADINPNDIESMSVLKGAAATALYGSRAANGVILITTKKGKKSKTLGVNVSSSATFGTVDKKTFPKYQQAYGGGYGPYYSGGDHPGLEEFDLDGDGVDDLVVPFYEDASFGEKFDPNLMVYQWHSLYPDSKYYQQKTPWVAAKNGPIYFFETAATYTNTVDISGGSDVANFRFSYTNTKESGIMPNSMLKKNNFNITSSYDIVKNLKATVSAQYINTKGKGRNSTGYSDNIMSSFRQWYQVNVDLKEQQELYHKRLENNTWNPVYYDDLAPAYWDNPYWVRFKNYETDQRDRLIGYTMLEWKISSAFNIMARGSVDTYNELQEERKAFGSSSGEFGVNLPGQNRPECTSGYSRLNRRFIETNFDLMARFQKDLTEDINLSGLLGTNIRKTSIDRTFNSTNGGLSIPNLYALANSNSPMLPTQEALQELQVNGIFGSVSFGFRNFLFLDGTLRRDVSSTLPKDEWAYLYPSVSGSFIFSNLLDVPEISLGKFRVNYAEVGAGAPWGSIKDTYDQNSTFGGNVMISLPNTKNNPKLKPERSKSWETGLEMNFLQGRAGFDIAYYKINSVDQIMPVSISTATGYSTKFVNAGEIENKGIELSLSGTPIKTSDFAWDINIQYAKNKNKVVSLHEDIKNLRINALQGGISINARVDEPYGTIQGTDYTYAPNGQKLILANGFPQKTSQSDIVIGNVQPDWNAGIRNTFTYKDFALTALIDIQKGGDIFSLDLWYGMATGLYEETVYTNSLGNPVRDPLAQTQDPATGAWTQDPASGGYLIAGVLAADSVTPNTRFIAGDRYTAYGYARFPNKEFVYDASYVKLRELILTYTLPKGMLNKYFIQGASLSLIGTNLWIISKNLPHADPETSQGAGNTQGWQSGVLPTTRNFGFSINLQF